jgi:predicted metalloprotease with PDZ domain
LTVTYEVYAGDLSVRAAYLDPTRGYFNGPSVFVRAHGKEHDPCSVEILPPDGATYRGWQLATSMVREDAEPWGFGTYGAADYEELIDHPVEMGQFVLDSFEAGGIPHAVVITGHQRADKERLCADLKTLCEHHIRFFGGPPPMERYLFLIRAVGSGYGGLEHRASSSLLCSRDDLPRPGRGGGEIKDGYRGFLGLASHEYFHLWNVKRIKPKAFIPYDLSREVHTRLLWAFEGITSYYDDLALVRSGLITPESYLELLGQTATRVLRSSGRLKQTLEEASFDAWIKFYHPDENSPNATISYYTKGALVALALDLMIRHGSSDARSLDDVMQALWEQYGRAEIGVPEEGIERIAQEVSGLDLTAFFDQALRSTEDLPLKRLLAHVGVEFRLRPAESERDKGEKPSSQNEAQLAGRSVLGVTLAAGDAETKLAHVLDGGAAQEAGLAAGDILVAVDGLRVTRDALEKRIGAYEPGTRVRVVAFRRDELMEFDVSLKAAPADTCVLTFMEDVDEAVRQRRAAWLQGR